jgi:uncharacterized membrane protein
VGPTVIMQPTAESLKWMKGHSLLILLLLYVEWNIWYSIEQLVTGVKLQSIQREQEEGELLP